MNKVADIMSCQVISLTEQDKLYQAQQLMREHDIRHLPVLDKDGLFVGLLTQKAMLNSAFTIINTVGSAELATRQKQICVTDVMDPDPKTTTPDSLLVEVGDYFLTHKHSCLPVVQAGQLQGIITSMDFVKLCLALLNR